MNDNRVIKTYVWHKSKCFFVSTIERDSSAATCQSRYNETMVWLYDWDHSIREPNFIYQGEATCGSIVTHQAVVESLFNNGVCEREDT